MCNDSDLQNENHSFVLANKSPRHAVSGGMKVELCMDQSKGMGFVHPCTASEKAALSLSGEESKGSYGECACVCPCSLDF